jgi:hypothetical protein
VFDRETKFEVTEAAAARFVAAVDRAGEQEFKIAPAAPAPAPKSFAPRDTGPRKFNRKKAS